MASPPRQQQGPGGNMSLSPGGNGAAGGGGPPAAEGAGPAAGPELSRPQQYTIPGILHYIQHEWARFEMERAHWEVERAELQVPRWGRYAGRLRRLGSRPGVGGVGPGLPSFGTRGLGRPRGTYLCSSGGDSPGDGSSRTPLPLSRRSLLPRPHWLRGAGFLGAAILAFSMASAGAPPEAFCAGLRGLGPSSSLWENPAWGCRALRWLLFLPLKMENPRRGTGLGILPPFPGSPPCFRFGVTAPLPRSWEPLLFDSHASFQGCCRAQWLAADL